MPEPLFACQEIRPSKPVTTTPIVPSAALEAAYRRKMRKLIDEMHDSVVYWLTCAYRNNEPLIAMDAAPVEARDMVEALRLIIGPVGEGGERVLAMDDMLPANVLGKIMRKFSRRWLKRFKIGSEEMAEFFSKSVKKRTDEEMARIMRKAGFSVRFKMTRPMLDVVNATTAENVSLIKSIPQKYLSDVEQAVMRSVQAGRDLGSLTKSLQETYGVTRRRAALIARDQNNKASAVMTRARQQNLGITKAKWRHSGGGKHPRPTHVAMDGKLYDIAEGMWDSHEKKFVFPGELINCRCQSISVIPGFE